MKLKIFFGLLLSTLLTQQAKALVTHELEYTRLDGSGTLTGTFVFDESSIQFGNFQV